MSSGRTGLDRRDWQGRDHLLDGWWLTAFPGAAIALTVLGYHILGDGLDARLDPRRERGGSDE